MKKEYSELDRIISLPPNHIFVFGSNRLGIHKRGAALDALKYFKARFGQGEGLQGNSYAIPTKRTPFSSLSLLEVKTHIDRFIDFATSRRDLTFVVTPIGTGLAKFKEEDIIPLFAEIPDNVVLPELWKIKINNEFKV